MFKTLYARLSFALFILFIIVGGAFVVSALNTAHMYQQEVSQRLNRDLAMYIAEEHVLIENGKVNIADLEKLFASAMMINPSLQLYLLDTQGNVVGYSGDTVDIKRMQVSLANVDTLLKSSDKSLVLGDDPKSIDKQKAFSAAPIKKNGKLEGYIYAVLGSDQVDFITELLHKSYIMKLSVVTLVVSLLFAFAGGMIIFFLLTRRLRKLSVSMDSFRCDDYKQPVTDIHASGENDEIDRMTHTFIEMSQHIQAQMESLRENDALRREMVANISHDLRTPLASLQGYLEILNLKNNELSESDRKKYLTIAQKNSARLNKLVEELFELAKLDANEVTLHKEAFSIAELVYDVVHKFQLRAEELGIKVDVQIDCKEPYVEADIGLIERVLDNLIDNALKHTNREGTIKLELISKGRDVIINVIDDGDGIPEDVLPHIFERFYKKPTEEKSYTGAGLGLAIAQRIVELHGSQLSVHSAVEKGTMFDFTLPVYNYAS